MRTLLHLHNQFELEGFGEMRFKAMIALLASDEETKQLVKYLTDQFYAQNYSISQRYRSRAISGCCRPLPFYRYLLLLIMIVVSKGWTCWW
jgi:hypothetical protein